LGVDETGNRGDDSRMDEFAALGIDSTTTPGEGPGMPGASAKFFSWPWLSIVLIAVSVSLWAANWADLLEWTGAFGFGVLLGAGPLALAGTALAARNITHANRPRWVSIAGLIMGIVATAYIGLQFLEFLAAAAFA
jgi:hypothetical protein